MAEMWGLVREMSFQAVRTAFAKVPRKGLHSTNGGVKEIPQGCSWSSGVGWRKNGAKRTAKGHVILP